MSFKFKPHISYTIDTKPVDKEYKTYRLLLEDLKVHLAEADECIVHVFRSRRGEWGEWFEIWNGKIHPRIIKQGWQ